MKSPIASLRKTSLVLIVGLSLIGRTLAAPREVRDGASFFSPAAVSQANASIKEIRRLYQKDLHVETFLTPPANLKDAFQKNSNKAFADWAQSQATKDKIEGVYVLICKTPAHLEVLVDKATLKKAFPAKDRDTLRDVLVGHFKAKTFDDGLAAIIALTRERLEQNLGPVVSPPLANEVQDRDQFFSPKLIARINAEIKEFHQRFKKDLIIETIAAPPADKQKLLDTANAAEKNKIFGKWLHERAQAAKTDGVVVLICRKPPHIQVEVTAGMASKAFTHKDREQLLEILLNHFRAKEFDKALETSLDFVYDTVDRNVSPPPAPPAVGTIKDNAGLFSAAAVERAKKEIQTLANNDRQTLTIETFPQPPPGQVKRVEARSPEAREAFFAEWLKERMQSNKAPGIYIMICKHPGKLQIGLDDALQAKAFTPANRDELAKIMNEQFQAKQFDQGLFRGLDYIQTTLAKSAPVLAVKDEAGFFSSAAIEKANAAIRDIRRRYQKDVLVESFKEVPPSRVAETDLSDPKARGKLFATWAEERRKSLHNDGLAILICKEPMTLQVATAAKGLLADQRDEVVKLLLARFGAKQYDAGLAEALQHVEQTLQKKLLAKADKSEPIAKAPNPETKPTAAPKAEPKIEPNVDSVAEATPPATKKSMSPPSTERVSERVGFDVMWVVWGFAIVGGLWLLIGILRALFGAGRRAPPPPPAQAAAAPQSPPSVPSYGSAPYAQKPYPPQQQPYPPQYPYPVPPQSPPAQGGGFLPSLMGGLFGAAAGNWMYDRFRGGNNVSIFSGSQSTPPPVTYTPPSSTPIGYTPPGTDPATDGYSSAGGDFGDSASPQTDYTSSGGDFGQPAPPDYASSGGDFGQPVPPQADYASSGGDFSAPAQDFANAGGDFSAPVPPDSYDVASGGDISIPEPPATDGGGDQNTSGGDFGSRDPNEG